jgi:glutaryl-CoA dehydrogenase
LRTNIQTDQCKSINFENSIIYSADIELTDVFVPQKNRLENALDFALGANNILKHSRLFVAWIATGCAAGAIESAIKYTL